MKSWVRNQKIVLSPNEFFKSSAKDRPEVEVVFASEDSAALTLYEKGVINFLWRLDDIEIPKFKNRPDFIQILQARYDYMGFNQRPGSFFAKKENRKAFVEGISYVDFTKAFPGFLELGCPSLSEPFLTTGHCVVTDSKPSPLQPLQAAKPIKFMFSELGGDDVRREVEWFQEQWHKTLGVKIESQGMEQAHYRAFLKSTPPDIFRMGIALNRPSCLAALEKFSKGNPENFTGFENANFDNFVRVLSRQKLSRAEQEGVCGAATDILFKQEYVGIPMGKMQFTMLMDPHFQGWKLNELNQLDLSDLTYVEKK